VRVAILARRFAPAICAALDEGARIDVDGRTLTAADGTRALSPNGSVEQMAAA
jgi:hypothetical protein